MPPKKKSRVPTTADTSDAAAPSTPGPTPSSAPTSTAHLLTEPVLSDGWTDEQEITLFKAIAVYRWKPAGMHKHFRMLSITQLMRNHGVFDTHTSPPGIWAKLHTLYNLEGLDEREDMPDDEGDGVSSGYTDFRLPEEEFGEM
ncbi:chromatin modification-related protein EAF7-domain-containing protein, partial [Terfezia claveryi]